MSNPNATAGYDYPNIQGQALGQNSSFYVLKIDNCLRDLSCKGNPDQLANYQVVIRSTQ